MLKICTVLLLTDLTKIIGEKIVLCTFALRASHHLPLSYPLYGVSYICAVLGTGMWKRKRSLESEAAEAAVF